MLRQPRDNIFGISVLSGATSWSFLTPMTDWSPKAQPQLKFKYASNINIQPQACLRCSKVRFDSIEQGSKSTHSKIHILFIHGRVLKFANRCVTEDDYDPGKSFKNIELFMLNLGGETSAKKRAKMWPRADRLQDAANAVKPSWHCVPSVVSFDRSVSL